MPRVQPMTHSVLSRCGSPRAILDTFIENELGPVFEKVGGMPEPRMMRFEVHNCHP